MSAYVHIPFCLKKCFYCAFPIHSIGQSLTNQEYFKNQLEQQYVAKLNQEIHQIYKGEKLQTLYFGGGTPSLLSIQNLKLIINCFKLQSNAEISIEADPKTFDVDKLKQFQELGFNRLSIGIQSLQDQTLQKLNRSHNNYDIQEALDAVQKVYGSFDNCTLDLLYNLPVEFEQKELEDIEYVKNKLQPGHLSIYSLSIEEESYFYKKLNYRDGVAPLPDHNKQAQKYQDVHNLLNNYIHYEISNFAANESKISQHNKNYWLGNSDFYGFGMGATSLKDQVRITRPKNLKKYFEYVENGNGCLVEDERSDFEKQRVLLMSRLRTIWGIEKSLLSLNLLKAMERYSEFLIMDDDRVRLKIPDGYLVCDEIVGDLQNIK